MVCLAAGNREPAAGSKTIEAKKEEASKGEGNQG